MGHRHIVKTIVGASLGVPVAGIAGERLLAQVMPVEISQALVSQPVQLASAAIAAAAAVVVAEATRRMLRVGAITLRPFSGQHHSPRQLVTDGLYGVVRNPLLLGTYAFLLGLACLFNSLPMLLLSLAWIGVSNLLLRYLEEPGLRLRFGPEYDQYCLSVPRFLPLTGGASSAARKIASLRT